MHEELYNVTKFIKLYICAKKSKLHNIILSWLGSKREELDSFKGGSSYSSTIIGH